MESGIRDVKTRDISDFDNISVTAYRIISILNMLLESQCNDKDINEKLQEDIIGARPLSRDTIYIYINTLRALDCIISKPTKNNNYMYELKSHPFKLKLNSSEISSLFEIRKCVSFLDEWKQLINIDNLLDLIIENHSPEDKKTFIQLRKSCIRDIETQCQANLINLLDKYCNKKRTLKILYSSPESGEKIIEILVEKLTYENGAIYLWGYNTELDESQYLRVDRITKILAVNIKNTEKKPKLISVKYKLTGISAQLFAPSKDEKMSKINDDEILVETVIKNKFRFIQRILSYGNECTVLSPISIRKEIINKLENMCNLYEQDTEVLS